MIYKRQQQLELELTIKNDVEFYSFSTHSDMFLLYVSFSLLTFVHEKCFSFPNCYVKYPREWIFAEAQALWTLMLCSLLSVFWIIPVTQAVL